MPSSCLFVLAGASRAEATAAAERVRRWLSPLELSLSTLWHPACGALIGAAAGSGSAGELRPERGLIDWGEAPPSGLSRPSQLLEATPEGLRALDRSIALVAYDEERIRVATGSSGPLPLYHATEGGRSSWSTSAVLAAILVRPSERIRLDRSAIPQLLAFGFVGGTATQLAGVDAVAPATAIDLVRGDPPRALAYWPPAERWAPLPEAEASEAADRGLLAGLSARLDGGRPYLGLTAGADSRVAALALAELGLPAGTMTWGVPGHADVDAAAGVARRLGFEHVTLSGGWHADVSLEDELERAARRQEGLSSPPLLGSPEWPDDLETFVTGGGGETARAFYYRLLGRLRSAPSIEAIADLWRPEAVIGQASASARQAVRDAKLGFLSEAAATGHTGWRLLDVVYAEQRVRRWGRGILPTGPRHVVASLSGTELNRAFASLPDTDRLTDGWHRRFIERRAPDLALPPPPAPRRGVPAPLRRAAERWRRTRHEGSARHHYADAFDERPAVKAWILDEALGNEAVAEAMGPQWQRWARDGFRAGSALETEQALQAAGLASLERALRGLA